MSQLRRTFRRMIPKWLADLCLRINRLYYVGLFERVRRRKNRPPWFDHRIDLYYLWPNNLFWLERGILPRKHMFEGCAVLDLFCGDGYYSRYFYSTIAGHIDALDKDPGAIAHARKWHSHPRIRYVQADAVHEDFPQSRYDVICWYEAIEHVRRSEYEAVIGRIKAAIGEAGVLLGSTPIVPADHLGKSNWQHQNEFTSVDSLREFLRKDFAEVKIDTTVYPTSDGHTRRTAHFTLRLPKG